MTFGKLLRDKKVGEHCRIQGLGGVWKVVEIIEDKHTWKVQNTHDTANNILTLLGSTPLKK